MKPCETHGPVRMKSEKDNVMWKDNDPLGPRVDVEKCGDPLLVKTLAR